MPELNISHLDQRAAKCITFNSLQPDSDQKTSQMAWKRIFSKISRSEWVNTFEIVKFFFVFHMFPKICDLHDFRARYQKRVSLAFHYSMKEA